MGSRTAVKTFFTPFIFKFIAVVCFCAMHELSKGENLFTIPSTRLKVPVPLRCMATLQSLEILHQAWVQHRI